jgi:aminoglycoside phosphotransferase
MTTGTAALLNTPDALSRRVAGAALSRALGWPPTRCDVLDAKIEAVGTTVLYRLGGRLVTARSVDAHPLDGGCEVRELGLRAWVFPDDPALPGLALVIDPAGMADALRVALPPDPGGAALMRCTVALARYRPGRRATLRVDAWFKRGRHAHRRTYYVKVYHDRQKAAAVWEVTTRLAAARPIRDGRVSVPPVVAFAPQVPMLVQEPVPGKPLDLLLGPLHGTAVRPEPRAVAGVIAAAGALAALHEVEPSAGKERLLVKEAQRMFRRSEAVSALDRDLGRQMTGVATALTSAAADLPYVVAGGHGDCKPSQFLVGAGGTGVLDFDHAGPADPVADVATFAASLTQLALWQAITPQDPPAAGARTQWLTELRGQFVAEYARRVYRSPDFDRRIACHEAAALLRKALRAFARSPRSPLPAALVKAAQHGLTVGAGQQ